ncbi:MAG: LysM peptidoglycan-binding domain-containing protein [Chlorobi bacterium]|nr:LysM peptidoglycan-binding domain-containing protein [Chlorobiota bacterium]
MSLEINKLIEFAEKSNRGMVEEHNQDFSGVFETKNGTVGIVCGGIKERTGTSIASKIVVKSIGEYFKNKKYRNLQKALYNAVIFANQQVFEQAAKNDKLKNMATTLVVALVNKNQLYYAYVGNSRLYILKNEKLQKLTKDHTFGQQMLDAGKTPEEIQKHPRKNELLNIVGVSRDLRFSICKTPLGLNDNDQILLCSDGLINELNENEIKHTLLDADISVEHKTAKLIDKANAKGGKDNVTAILIRYDSNMPVNDNLRERKKINPLAIIIPIVVLLAAVGIYLLVVNKIPQKVYSSLKERFFNKEIVVDSTQLVIIDSTLLQIDTTMISDSLELIAEQSLLHDTVIVYTVKKDENMYRIGLHFNIPADELAAFNGIKPEVISEGEKIKIPVKGTYIVNEGDLIYQLAVKFKVDYKTIIEANSLNTFEYLVVGNELYIPYQKGEYKVKDAE